MSRFVLTSNAAEVEGALRDRSSRRAAAGPPRVYNIAPTQPILLVTSGPMAAPGPNIPARRAMLARWWCFCPAGSRIPKEFPLLINARSETAATKASFRAAMRHRRVLIPASGFFSSGGARRGRKSQGLLDQAQGRGRRRLWRPAMETWTEPRRLGDRHRRHPDDRRQQDDRDTFHDRMPVIIHPGPVHAAGSTASPASRPTSRDLMRPAPEELMEAIPISKTRSTKVANAGPRHSRAGGGGGPRQARPRPGGSQRPAPRFF